jgi:hypothetical protein
MDDSMERSEKNRKLILGGLLIATLILIFVIEDEAEIYPIQSVQSMQTKKTYTEIESISEEDSKYLDVEQLGQRKFNTEAGELFNAISWGESGSIDKRVKKESALKKTIQKNIVSSSVASKPPPLRFQYLGKIIHNNEMKIILSQFGEKVVVKLGERIDDKYRIDAMDNEAITLTYLPLNVEQTLIINDPEKRR